MRCRDTFPLSIVIAAEPPHELHGSALPQPVPSREAAPAATGALLRAIPSATPRPPNGVHCGQLRHLHNRSLGSIHGSSGDYLTGLGLAEPFRRDGRRRMLKIAGVIRPTWHPGAK